MFRYKTTGNETSHGARLQRAPESFLSRADIRTAFKQSADQRRGFLHSAFAAAARAAKVARAGQMPDPLQYGLGDLASRFSQPDAPLLLPGCAISL